MKNRPFLNRLGFAIQGLREGWQREYSFRAQVMIGLIIALSVVLLGASSIWLAIVGLAIALVLGAELFNSALETLVDRLHPEIHPEIRVVKDMAAAGVLLICLGASARSFLSMPSPDPGKWIGDHVPAPRGSTESARRLLAMTRPVGRTLVEQYLRNRGITALSETSALRYHPRCYYRADEYAPTETWPAMIAAVTDLFGKLTGAHRTWLDPGGFSDANLGRAPLSTPRRAMGNLLGHAVRFGTGCDVMLAGEGIETTLSVKSALPHLASMAALSAGHLAAIAFPHTLRRLYVARDNDPAGDAAMATLFERTRAVGIEAITLSPRLIDFNEDLRLLGLDALTARLKLQVAPQDVARFMCSTG